MPTSDAPPPSPDPSPSPAQLLGEIRYPEQLPVSQCREELLAAIRDHQVVIVAGETGSGKTTQLPKLCLELGRGTRGLIGHTQPRRLAARTVAGRIAEELGTELGGVVGYQVRFTDRVGGQTMVKLMTDGILLTEIAHDRMLRRYDTIIVDEAHERSLNIDFILGYLRQLLPRRPDLKVIITSATIDAQRFSAHFGDAPVLEVSGRTWPVELRYRPYAEDADRDAMDAICDAVTELCAEGPGDILVFLSGEREIRDAADALGRSGPRGAEILPLYARLSAAEQHRVFAPHAGRRIVLATNVAETSLTVPGIRYVVDPGNARISRYSHRLKVQRLPIEPVSQASANQRAGRCGRVADGICIRLYSEDDFAGRPEYTDPEILRTNLASVILQMTAIGLGSDLAGFGFLDPPDQRAVTDGIRLLEELGAFQAGADPGGRRRLTPLGRTLSRLPVDPRMARMVIEADRGGCLADVLVIVAALSIQDPRERPLDRQQAADAAHARFADPDSDFLTLVNLWRYLAERQRALSSSQFRRLCRTEFLNHLRVREWQDLHAQLRQVVRGLGMSPASAPLDGPAAATGGAAVATGGAGPAAGAGSAAGDGEPVLGGPSAPDRLRRVHTALLAGLLSHVGMKDTEVRGGDQRGGEQRGSERRGQERRGSERTDYLGARGSRFAIFPGSALARRQPRWVMAAELVETSRLWARAVGRIEPEWVEPLAGHLIKRNYSEPHWSKRRGAVVGYEKVTLYGVPLVARREINFDRVDPQLCRELFIRHALVEGDWDTHHRFFHDNRALVAEVQELEHRARRRDILVDDEQLFAFYDDRLPAEIVTARHFDAWWKRTRRSQPQLLMFDLATLTNDGTGDVSPAQYPDGWQHDGVRLPLRYTFEPGAPADGVTVQVPLPLLAQVSGDAFGWQVPGLREELVVALLRSLPKELRRNFVPVPDVAREVLARMRPEPGPMLGALERELHALTGVSVPRAAWQLDRVPGHLKMNIQVIDEAERPLAEGRDLGTLREQLAGQLRAAFAEATGDLTRTGMRGWDLDTLQRTVRWQRGQALVTGYPALVDEGTSVGVRVFETAADQVVAMAAGTRRLLTLTVPSPVKLVNAQLDNLAKLALSRNPHRSAADLLDDCVACAMDHCIEQAGGPAWDANGFAALRERVRADLGRTTLEVVHVVRGALAAAYPLGQRLEPPAQPALAAAVADLRGQLAGLVYRGFVAQTGWRHLPDLPRYLTGMQRRLEKLSQDPRRDAERMAVVAQVRKEYDQLAAGRPASAALLEIRWMIEELRVNLFAQALGTRYPISDRRIYRAMDDFEAANP